MPKKIKKFLAIVLIILLDLVVASLIVILAINIWVNKVSDGKTYTDLSQIPARKVGLLLGTSSSSYNGKPNAYFEYRIQAATDLYNAGKIEYILVSGDNSKSYYNEPIDMQNALIAKGIPSGKIYLDYAGFRTLDSVVRAKEIFGETKLTVISQEFHNRRAIVIAQHFGIDLIGYNAQDIPLQLGWKTQLREVFARVQLVWDLYTGTQPRFLGEQIDIG